MDSREDTTPGQPSHAAEPRGACILCGEDNVSSSFEYLRSVRHAHLIDRAPATDGWLALHCFGFPPEKGSNPSDGKIDLVSHALPCVLAQAVPIYH